MARLPLAVVTMAYNEEDLLPIWLRHHRRQVGAENCYILDHGSTDASMAQTAGANVLHLPRTPLDEIQRCAYVSDFCASLLAWYDFVAYTDADELLVADPARHDGLLSLCRSLPHDVVTAFGVNVVHRLGQEQELVPTGLISRQRAWMMPLASMCKPAIISRPVRWAPGFHCADTDIVFGDLLLHHLAYADLDVAVRRQRKRNVQPRASAEENPHHQVGAEQIVAWMRDWSSLDEVTGVDLGPECAERAAFTSRLIGSGAGRECERYRIDISMVDYRLWRLPDRFMGIF